MIFSGNQAEGQTLPPAFFIIFLALMACGPRRPALARLDLTPAAPTLTNTATPSASLSTLEPAPRASLPAPQQEKRAAPTGSHSDNPGPVPCSPDLCIQPGLFSLSRPIAAPGRAQADLTYPFGSTQNGAREPHHGVEFVNSSGTPVLAAEDGRVVFAGDDRQEIFSDWPNFYGKLVILEHDLPEIDLRVFTLYAHLSQVQVQAGDEVAQGQAIGQVGFSGVATGSHLHFEVRLGENAYDRVQNPALWLAPGVDESGQAYGALAGRIEYGAGETLYVPNLVLERLPKPGGDPFWQRYLETYADPRLAGDPQWRENFALGDLPAGWYRITFVARGLQVAEVQVLPAQVTFIRFDVGE